MLSYIFACQMQVQQGFSVADTCLMWGDFLHRHHAETDNVYVSIACHSYCVIAVEVHGTINEVDVYKAQQHNPCCLLIGGHNTGIIEFTRRLIIDICNLKQPVQEGLWMTDVVQLCQLGKALKHNSVVG